MEEQIAPERILDIFLEYLVSLPNLTGKTISQIQEQNITYPLRDIQEIIGKLKKDGYAWHDYETENSSHKIEPHYTSTFEGRIFIKNGGYVAKSLADAADAEEQRLEIARLTSVDVSSGQNQTRLNTLTRRLVWATWFAFGAAILVFFWQIVLWYYPTNKDFVHRNDVEKIAPKKP